MNQNKSDDASERPIDLIVMHKIERYLRQLAPHQKEREGPQMLREAVAVMESSDRAWAKVAELEDIIIGMLRYAPGGEIERLRDGVKQIAPDLVEFVVPGEEKTWT